MSLVVLSHRRDAAAAAAAAAPARRRQPLGDHGSPAQRRARGQEDEGRKHRRSKSSALSAETSALRQLLLARQQAAKHATGLDAPQAQPPFARAAEAVQDAADQMQGGLGHRAAHLARLLLGLAEARACARLDGWLPPLERGLALLHRLEALGPLSQALRLRTRLHCMLGNTHETVAAAREMVRAARQRVGARHAGPEALADALMVLAAALAAAGAWRAAIGRALQSEDSDVDVVRRACEAGQGTPCLSALRLRLHCALSLLLLQLRRVRSGGPAGGDAGPGDANAVAGKASAVGVIDTAATAAARFSPPRTTLVSRAPAAGTVLRPSLHFATTQPPIGGSLVQMRVRRDSGNEDDGEESGRAQRQLPPSLLQPRGLACCAATLLMRHKRVPERMLQLSAPADAATTADGPAVWPDWPAGLSAHDLLRALPPGCVFVDYVCMQFAEEPVKCLLGLTHTHARYAAVVAARAPSRGAAGAAGDATSCAEGGAEAAAAADAEEEEQDGATLVRVLDLGPARDVDSCAARFVASVAGGAQLSDVTLRTYGGWLRRRVIDPVAKALWDWLAQQPAPDAPAAEDPVRVLGLPPGMRLWVISPDAQLSRVPFAALPMPAAFVEGRMQDALSGEPEPVSESDGPDPSKALCLADCCVLTLVPDGWALAALLQREAARSAGRDRQPGTSAARQPLSAAVLMPAPAAPLDLAEDCVDDIPLTGHTARMPLALRHQLSARVSSASPASQSPPPSLLQLQQQQQQQAAVRQLQRSPSQQRTSANASPTGWTLLVRSPKVSPATTPRDISTSGTHPMLTARQSARAAPPPPVHSATLELLCETRLVPCRDAGEVASVLRKTAPDVCQLSLPLCRAPAGSGGNDASEAPPSGSQVRPDADALGAAKGEEGDDDRDGDDRDGDDTAYPLRTWSIAPPVGDVVPVREEALVACERERIVTCRATAADAAAATAVTPRALALAPLAPVSLLVLPCADDSLLLQQRHSQDAGADLLGIADGALRAGACSALLCAFAVPPQQLRELLDAALVHWAARRDLAHAPAGAAGGRSTVVHVSATVGGGAAVRGGPVVGGSAVVVSSTAAAAGGSQLIMSRSAGASSPAAVERLGGVPDGACAAARALHVAIQRFRQAHPRCPVRWWAGVWAVGAPGAALPPLAPPSPTSPTRRRVHRSKSSARHKKKGSLLEKCTVM